MQETFASYVEGLERAGIDGLRQLPVPIISYQGELHLRRSSGIRLCDWRTGGDHTTHTVDELTRSSDLCNGCFPGAFGVWTTLHDLSTAGILGLARLVIGTVEAAEKSIKRLGNGQVVSSGKVYQQLHHLRLLEKEARNAAQWPGASSDTLEVLATRTGGTLERLRAVLTSGTQQEKVLAKVLRNEAKVKDPMPACLQPTAWYVLSYRSDISEALTQLPMLASEVVATYHIREDKGTTVLHLPGSVAEYLDRVAGRAKDWRLRAFRVHPAPDDPEVLETALGIWDPAGQGELTDFNKAVTAAEMLKE